MVPARRGPGIGRTEARALNRRSRPATRGECARLNAFPVRSAIIGLCVATLMGCTQAGPSSAPCVEDRLLAVAAEFYRGSKAAKESGFSGGRLFYGLQDEGDQWQVTVAPADTIGSGHVILIRKSDMQVTDLDIRTQ